MVGLVTALEARFRRFAKCRRGFLQSHGESVRSRAAASLPLDDVFYAMRFLVFGRL